MPVFESAEITIINASSKLISNIEINDAKIGISDK